MLLHSVSVRRAGSKTIVRLTQAEWCTEVDVCCTLAWVNLVSKRVFLIHRRMRSLSQSRVSYSDFLFTQLVASLMVFNPAANSLRLEEMASATCDDGSSMFTAEALEAVRKRCVEGPLGKIMQKYSVRSMVSPLYTPCEPIGLIISHLGWGACSNT